MELDPRRLRVLRAVALRGGVVDAAALLHLTPSAVSQQLAQLEQEVGLSLVDRSRRRVGLTPAGRLLAARAERIEQELAEARRELAELSGRVSGPVTIAAFPTAICHLLVPALQRLSRTHPELRPMVVDLEGPEALRELRTGGIDLVVAEGDVDGSGPGGRDSDLFSDPIADDPYRVVVPAGLHCPHDSIGQLSTLPWVAGPAGSACGRALDRIAAEHGFKPRRAHVCLEFPAVLALVAAGLGAAIVPTLALKNTTPDSITVLDLPVTGQRRITALRRASLAGPEPVAEALIGELRKSARDMGRSVG